MKNHETPFHRQFRICDSDGTTRHMSRAAHDSMPEDQRKEYADYKYEHRMPADYYGPRGPLFCGIAPGLCSLAHCPKLKAESLSA